MSTTFYTSLQVLHTADSVIFCFLKETNVQSTSITQTVTWNPKLKAIRFSSFPLEIYQSYIKTESSSSINWATPDCLAFNICIWRKIYSEPSLFFWHTWTKEITVQIIKISFLFLPETIKESTKSYHVINNTYQTQFSNMHLVQSYEHKQTTAVAWSSILSSSTDNQICGTAGEVQNSLNSKNGLINILH